MSESGGEHEGGLSNCILGIDTWEGTGIEHREKLNNGANSTISAESTGALDTALPSCLIWVETAGSLNLPVVNSCMWTVLGRA